MSSQTKAKYVLVLFLIVSVIDIIGVQTQQINIRNISKPFVLLTLMIYYYLSVKKVNKWYILGMFFSFLGDVFLLGEGEQYFMLGLGSFLIAHLLYIKITLKIKSNKTKQKIVISIIPFILFFSLLITILKEHLEKLLIPVVVYGIVISTFGIVTMLNYISKKTKANLYLFLGAMFFIASDSMLAINKFYSTKEILGVLVMTTYIIAQYLICRSLIKQQKII